MRALFLTFVLLVTSILSSVVSAEPLSKPARLVMYQGGDYLDYYKTLRSMTKGLMELGVIESQPIPEFPNYNTQALWSWLSTQASNDQITFVREGFYSADWDDQKRDLLRLQLERELNQGKLADIVLAIGTWAGMDISNIKHNVPSLVMSTSNAVYSGIVDSVSDSGADHLFAAMSPDRYFNQLSMYHDLIGFKRLGVAYENSLAGRSYAAIADIERLAKERGFEIVSCYTKSDISDYALAEQSLLECYEYLSDKSDALYITEQGGMLPGTHQKIVQLSIEKRLPTFSQYGQDEVRKGYLLSASRSFGLVTEGRFVADAMKQIMKGTKPRDIPQVFHETPDIYLNMKTAEVIGFHMNAYLLAAADQLYWRIETQE